jgi:hypothetical protein
MVTRMIAEYLGQPRSGFFSDVTRGAIPALVALPLLGKVSYRKRDALLIYFLPVVAIWLLPLIGWRLPVVQHPDWPPRPAKRSPEPDGPRGGTGPDGAAAARPQ